ncbi:unnamed protein product, partial [Symbiodinium sp. KB8]
VVYTNRKPRARALLRLVVRVGSLAEEEENYLGAYGIEHMVFRGTPSFPANDLKRFLERCGLSWGADLNAETGMEQHTTYSLDIPLKKNSTELLATGLRVLKVVEEEWRGRLGVEQRVEDKFWAEVFAGTLHSQRLPIGKMETLRRCPDERLRAFYKRWYRPQQMTILCIGDFGSNTVAKTLIEKAFADVQPSQDAEQQWTPPPLSARPRASVVYRDQELSSYVVRLRFFFEETTRRTLPEMVGAVASSAPFLSAAANEEAWVSSSKGPRPLRHLERSLPACRHGLSEREMELTRKFHCTALDSVWAERHHVDSEDVLECAEDFVLSGEQTRLCSDCMDVRLQHEALEALQLLAKGPLADPQLQRVASELFNFAAGRWSIEAEMAGDDSTDLEPEVTPGDLRQAMEQFAARAELPPFAWLPGELLDPNVTWLRTDFEPDEILIQGLLPCGLSELGSAALRASCSHPPGVCYVRLLLVGGGGLFQAQLQEYLADANASVLPGVQMYSRFISGRCGASAQNLEMALRSLQFLPANFTESSFGKVLDATAQRIENREREPEYHFEKKLKEITCGNDPFFHETTLQDVHELRKMGVEGARQMADRLFGDSKAWSWVIVGALPPDDELRELLERSLQPPKSREEEERQNAASHTLLRRRYSGLSDAARVCVCFEVEGRHAASAQQRLALHWLADIMEVRLVEKMRMESGSTYNVSCTMSTGSTDLPCKDRRPLLSIDFSCDPTAVQKQVDCLFEEIRRLTSRTSPVTSEELETCRKQERERVAVEERENRWWLGRLCSAVRRVRSGTEAEHFGVVARES